MKSSAVPGEPLTHTKGDDYGMPSGSDSDLIDGLVSQLEAASDSDNDDDDDSRTKRCRGKRQPKQDEKATDEDRERAPVMWPALQYATYITGMHYFVREKHRVQSILADEVARVEDELRAEDGDHNIQREGDINLYSLEQQRKRRANKKSPGFLWAVRRLWDSTELKRSRENGSGYKETSGKIATGVAKRDTVSTAAAATVTGGVNAGFEPGIEKAAFVDLMLKVHFLIICPPVDRELALRNAALDWSKDNGDDDDETLMTYDRFVDSMFELVDIWTETSEEGEYAELSKMIVEGITIEDVNGASSNAAGPVEGRAAENGEAQELTKKKGAQLRLKRDDEIRYNQGITKEPVYLEDLQGNDDDGDGEGGEQGVGRDVNQPLYNQQKQRDQRQQTTFGANYEKDGRDNSGNKTGDKGVMQRMAEGALDDGERERRWGRSSAGDERKRRRMCRAMQKRRRSIDEDVANLGEDEGGGSRLARLTVSHRPNSPTSGKLLGLDRINTAIAKVYLSKMQVDGKLSKKTGKLSWADKSRRKKHQRMDRFVLQYHIHQFGTKKLARRNLHQLCKSVTKFSRQHPRIEVFADLVGVPVMIQAKPYQERLREYRPFACSDFVLPLLTRLCPQGEKLDRWMGNGKAPVAVTASDFLQAIREVCTHVPLVCPAMVGVTLQIGRLADRLENSYRQDAVALGKRPNGSRASIDLDEAILTALPLWSCEEEYMIMHVTLHSIRILSSWLKRSRLRRGNSDGDAHGQGDAQPSPRPGLSKTTTTTTTPAYPTGQSAVGSGKPQEQPPTASIAGQPGGANGEVADQGLELGSAGGDRTKKKKRSSAVGSAASAAAASAASSASGRERQRGGAEKTKKKSSLFTDPSSQVAAHAAVAAAILDEERSVKGGSIGGGKKKKKTSSVARPRDSAAREIAVRENNQALRQSASDTADGTMTTKTFDGGHSREEDPGSLTTVTKLPAPKDGVPRLSPATAGGNVPTSAVLKEGSTGSPRVKQRLQDAQDKDRTLSSA